MELLGDHGKTTKSDAMHTTYGHRGEALASIVAVSARVLLASKTSSSLEKEWRGGSVVRFGRAAFATGRGTTIVVEGLLHRLPVRRRLAGGDADVLAIRKCVDRVALMHPQVRFCVELQGVGDAAAGSLGTALSSVISPVCGVRERLQQVMGGLHVASLTEFSNSIGDEKGSDIVARGLTTLPGQDSQSSARFVFVFVNGRYVDRTPVNKLIETVYSSCGDVAEGRPTTSFSGPTAVAAVAAGVSWPIMVLQIQCRPQAYDIGYSPDRTIVEFKDWRQVVGCVRAALEDAITAEMPHLAPAFQGLSSAFRFARHSEETEGRLSSRSEVDATMSPKGCPCDSSSSASTSPTPQSPCSQSSCTDDGCDARAGTGHAPSFRHASASHRSPRFREKRTLALRQAHRVHDSRSLCLRSLRAVNQTRLDAAQDVEQPRDRLLGKCLRARTSQDTALRALKKRRTAEGLLINTRLKRQLQVAPQASSGSKPDLSPTQLRHRNCSMLRRRGAGV
eukprot:TRINITY_DN18688_c0_g1_i1.p1 TRINITY_DN18688_c0_g1~~TRINITY_DN18688_c0_g1_i1.p1  ORF type:complete len:573 (+),score=27.41 TRINITY_DN18688_c0_g1_i1:203-1720(+)